MTRAIKPLVFTAFFFVIATAHVLAQGGATGAISGTLQDPSGAVIPNADVQIVNQGTGDVVRTLKTGNDGIFTAQLLPVGRYTVRIRAQGFSDVSLTNIDVRVTETTRLTAKLQAAAVVQKVEVQGEVQAVETTAPTTGTSVESQTISSLPLATRNFQQLLTLSTGTASSLNQSASLGRGDVRIEVNGQREDNNNYQIEGISVSDYNVAELTNTPLPSPDVVDQFKVQTSLYDATQGRNGGGNINAILKTGTRQFHGSLFEYFRNPVLNANEWFLKEQGQPRPDIKQNIFGGSLGGPLGKEGKFGYFFVNYQGTRQRSGLSAGTIISTNLPTLPSDRSAQSIANAFLGGDASLIDPVALKLLQARSNQFGGAGGGYLIPSLAPSNPGNPSYAQQSLFSYSRPGKYTDDQFTTNYDRDFHGGNDHIAARFFFTNFESILPFGAGGLQASLGGGISRSDLNFPLDLPVHDRFLSLTETHIFNDHLLNEARFGWTRIVNDAINSPILTANDLGIDRPNNNIDNLIYKFTFNSSGFQIGPTPAANQHQAQNNYTILDTLSWTLGKHRLRLGGEYDRANLDKNFPQVFNGQVFFAPSAGPCPGGTCSDFQNFLLGNSYFSWAGSGVSNHEYRINDFALFAQDDFNLTPNLTINAGLRVEIDGAAYDLLNHIGNTVSAYTNEGKNPFIYPSGASSYNIPGLTANASSTTLSNNYSTGWGPRVGFAYDLFGRHTTSIRGGYGIYYVREDVGAVDQLSFTAPFLPIAFGASTPGQLGTLFQGILPKGGVIDPNFVPTYSQLLGFVDANGNPTRDTTQTPVFSGSAINLFGLEVPQKFVLPSTQQWNFTIQRQLPWNWILEVGYVGSKGTHLRETRDAIQPYNASPQHPVYVTAADGTQYVITQNTAANANARSRALGLAPSGYQLFANDAWSNYNSLQVTLRKNVSANFFVLGSYTYSKATDATSSGNTAFNTALNDQTSLLDSRGLSDFDRTHRLVVSYNYDLPFFRAATGARKWLLANWTVSGVSTFESGTPFSIYDSAGGTAFAPSSPNQSTAVWAPGATLASGATSGSVESRLTHYVNINAFTTAPVIGPDGSTGYGNVGRNLYRGPFVQNWDFTLGKRFPITERQAVTFRADFFNLFNHPNFSSPSTTDVQNPATFGTITTTEGTPRLIQFVLRYSF